MTTIICPKCGTENPDNVTNCTQCRINLQFALEHPDKMESAKLEETRQEEISPPQAVSKSETRIIVFALILLVVCCVVWLLSSMLLSPPVFGPCAHGGANYDTYQALVQYWSLHLIFGFFILVTRVYVAAEAKDESTARWVVFLNIAIGVWFVAAVLIWIVIFSWLCV